MQSDAELWSAFRLGNDGAFALLYERYKRPLYLFARRMLGDADLALDLVQDTFLAIHERREQLQRPERLRSWLFAAVRNRCLTRLRTEHRRRPIDDVPEDRLPAWSPPDEREAEAEVQIVRRALRELRVEYREVLILREYVELSYREIAEVTGSSESAVKSRLWKARRALYEALKPDFTERS